MMNMLYNIKKFYVFLINVPITTKLIGFFICSEHDENVFFGMQKQKKKKRGKNFVLKNRNNSPGTTATNLN